MNVNDAAYAFFFNREDNQPLLDGFEDVVAAGLDYLQGNDNHNNGNHNRNGLPSTITIVSSSTSNSGDSRSPSSPSGSDNDNELSSSSVSGSTSNDSAQHQQKPLVAKKKRRSWKKPADKPKRGFSAYNLFFQLERERLIAGQPERLYTPQDVQRVAVESHERSLVKRRHRKSHGKIGFTELARTIAINWKKRSCADKVVFEEYAAIEKDLYRKRLDVWLRNRSHESRRTTSKSSSVVNKSPEGHRQDLKPQAVPAPHGLMPDLNERPFAAPSEQSLLPASSAPAAPQAGANQGASGDHDITTQVNLILSNMANLEAMFTQGHALLQLQTSNSDNGLTPGLVQAQLLLVEQEFERQVQQLQQLQQQCNNGTKEPLVYVDNNSNDIGNSNNVDQPVGPFEPHPIPELQQGFPQIRQEQQHHKYAQQQSEQQEYTHLQHAGQQNVLYSSDTPLDFQQV
jgi:hypothetical protein